MNDALYPLRFRPLLKKYIWGGRRLGTVLRKDLGPEPNYAESWEICDHDEDQSVVEAGPLAGATLRDLTLQQGERLLGRHHPVDRFPLLLKFLDAAKTLSVQVHPDDAHAATLDPPDLGKTEAWLILAAEPGAAVYAGLKPEVDRDTLAAAIDSGNCEETLHRFEPAVGDCLFIAAGTVHALGEGLLVAEIQQASNTTYRLFDWNRLGTDGKPRPLHVKQGLEAIDFERGPVGPTTPIATDRWGVERLVECDKFVLERWRIDRPTTVGGDDRFHILSVLEGSLEVAEDAAERALTVGESILLPAGLGQVQLIPKEPTMLIESHLP